MKRPESVTRPGMKYLKWRRWEKYGTNPSLLLVLCQYCLKRCQEMTFLLPE